MQSYTEKPAQYFGHARKEIGTLLPATVGSVLEVGCGAGSTLKWLREERPAVKTVGIEISEAAAQLARQHVHEVHCLNFEQSTLPLNPATFDVVLCLDVLEHMVDPWKAIDRLVSDHLSPQGTIIISLPNVRHYSVVLPLLLNGRWDYEDAGLLDRTHLRFFTRSTAIELLAHPRLTDPKYVAMGFTKNTLKGMLNVLTFGMFQEFFTYQHYLVAKKQ